MFIYVNEKLTKFKNHMKKHYSGYHYIVQWILIVLIITVIFKILVDIFGLPNLKIPDTPLSKISYSIPTHRTLSLFSEDAPDLSNQFKVTPIDLQIKKTLAPPLNLFLGN
jgi:hypothetical protein